MSHTFRKTIEVNNKEEEEKKSNFLIDAAKGIGKAANKVAGLASPGGVSPGTIAGKVMPSVFKSVKDFAGFIKSSGQKALMLGGRKIKELEGVADKPVKETKPVKQEETTEKEFSLEKVISAVPDISRKLFTKASGITWEEFKGIASEFGDAFFDMFKDTFVTPLRRSTPPEESPEIVEDRKPFRFSDLSTQPVQTTPEDIEGSDKAIGYLIGRSDELSVTNDEIDNIVGEFNPTKKLVKIIDFYFEETVFSDVGFQPFDPVGIPRSALLNLGDTNVPASEASNFFVGVNAQRAGLSLKELKTGAMIYTLLVKVHRLVGINQTNSIAGEIKDWKLYEAGYQLAEDKGRGKLDIEDVKEYLIRGSKERNLGSDVAESPETIQTVEVSAYTADPAETNDRPRETATQTQVKEGRTIAVNDRSLLGKKVELDDVLYTIEDLMGPRFRKLFEETGELRFDIFMESKEEALEFGRQNKTIKILD